jgi:hypothetical protein
MKGTFSVRIEHPGTSKRYTYEAKDYYWTTDTSGTLIILSGCRKIASFAPGYWQRVELDD